jgi:hypothetical protein
MKQIKKYILFLGLVFLCSQAYGQCSSADIIPCIGMSKFQAKNTLSVMDNVYDLKEGKGYWANYEHLKGDSIYQYQINYKYKTHNCIKSIDNIVYLHFVEHKLFLIQFEINFKTTELKKCLENYNQIAESLKKEFPFYWTFFSNYSDGTFTQSQSEIDNQNGEGYTLFKSKEESQKEKPESVEIGYTEINKKGIIEKYTLTVKYQNKNGTKLNNGGHSLRYD